MHLFDTTHFAKLNTQNDSTPAILLPCMHGMHEQFSHVKHVDLSNS